MLAKIITQHICSQMVRIAIYVFLLTVALPSAAQIKVGVFLPFKSQGAVGQSAVEYYRGLLMAVDSLSHDGVRFDITAAHCGQTAQEMAALLDETKHGVFDIVFAPSNQEQIKVVDEYSRHNGTKVVVPFGGAYDGFISNPAFYALRVTQTDFTPEAYQLMVGAVGNKSLYVVSTNGGKTICPFANYVNKYVKGAKLLEWPKQEKKILQVLADGDAVVIPSMYDDETKNTIGSLADKCGEVRATVMGYPSWYDAVQTEADRKALCRMNAHVIMQYYPRNDLPRVKKFYAQYKDNFDTELPRAKFSYAMWGFDTGYYLFKGLNRYGADFYDQQLYAAPLQSGLHFKPRTSQSGLINTAVLLVHYKTDGTQELIEMASDR